MPASTAYTLLIKRRRIFKASECRLWVKNWVSRRSVKGAFTTLVLELDAEDPEKFRQFHRVGLHFEDILGDVERHISAIMQLGKAAINQIGQNALVFALL